MPDSLAAILLWDACLLQEALQIQAQARSQARLGARQRAAWTRTSAAIAGRVMTLAATTAVRSPFIRRLFPCMKKAFLSLVRPVVQFMCLYLGVGTCYLICLQGGGMMTAAAEMGMAVEAAS